MLSYKTCVCYLIYLKEKEMKAEEKEKHNLSLSFLEKQSNILLYSIDLLVSTMIIEWCGEVRNNKQTTLLKRYLNTTPAHCTAHNYRKRKEHETAYGCFDRNSRSNSTMSSLLFYRMLLHACMVESID